MATAPSDRADPGVNFARVVVALFKGVVYRDHDPSHWQALTQLEPRVRDYVSQIGLELILDDAEGYAYLQQRPPSEGEPEMPRLVARRQLTYPVSLLLVLLRKKLAEVDVDSGDTRLILSLNEIVEMVRVFFPESSNEARVVDKIETHLNKIVDLGFVRRLEGRNDQLEVRRILKAFVDAQWLQEFDQRLAQYRAAGSEDT
jgi:hypothetical protein